MVEERICGSDIDDKKEYFPPKIIHTEKIEVRAVVCARSDEATCGAGPLLS